MANYDEIRERLAMVQEIKHARTYVKVMYESIHQMTFKSTHTHVFRVRGLGSGV